MRAKISFVILHFLAYEDTSACIESICRNITESSYNIVIVDNASNNGSYEKLRNQYVANKYIHFISSEKNVGFAKGNNIGYNYAKEILGAEFIILLNNDTLITQKDFLEKVEEKYELQRYHILGPDIFSTKRKVHQNPLHLKGRTLESVEKKINRFERCVNDGSYFWKISIIKKLLAPITHFRRKFFMKKLARKERENVVLHGCCLILSPDYVNKYRGLYSGTFLYREEEILWYVAQREDMKLLYSPQLKLLHKEDVATDLFTDGSQKQIFLLKNSLKSLIELKKIMEVNQIYKEDMIVERKGA